MNRAAYLTGMAQSSSRQDGCLREWIEHSQKGWDVSDPLLADFLDGVLVIPLLLALHKIDGVLSGERILLFSLAAARDVV